MSFCPVCQSQYPDDWKRCPKDEVSLLRSRRVGKYAIEGLLGSGGMGAVYRARNPDTGAPVAVKLLHPGTDDNLRARFQREAKAVAGLTTRHVVEVYDFGETRGGELYLVMEFLRGHTVRDEIREPPERTPLQRVHLILDGALSGLAAAHRAGVIHRDLKPENIFVASTDDGEVVKVLDFGVARIDRAERSALTESGAIIGTPAYMAPEQVATKRGPISAASDCYAMGVIAYELFSGSAPFYAASIAEVLTQILTREFEDLKAVRPDLPDEVRAFIDRALDGDSDKRFADGGEMREAWREAYRAFGPKVTEAATPKFVPPPAEEADPKAATDIAPSKVPVTRRYSEADTVALVGSETDEVAPQKPAKAAGGVIAMAIALIGVAGLWTFWPQLTGKGGQGGDDAGPKRSDAAVVTDRDAGARVDAAADATLPEPVVPDGMVAFGGGTFEIGVSQVVARQYRDATPRRQVEVAPFYLDANEYTEAGSSMPLHSVSWSRAKELCEATGKRLPTELEWEFAATRSPLQASGARLRQPGGESGPAPVGTHPGDCTGDRVCDLLGNLAEWTADEWQTRDGVDPGRRAVRGGSYQVSPAAAFHASVQARTGVAPDAEDPEIGFRCAQTAEM